ncbi:MAG TPA: RdgB/HAM1 family non-canonical purine NTP pyrophosphatase [Intrasporangium sp.]|uniref:RdgB/HAM1 family non-canonical purine NTP pyrophosphatase n=1 Tax=Intrasporangium sp. TaxID=1925024 RepID=UPI002D77AB06|nr:RdgB/HAM1 family non-canonical purine NTP pyrophosphatase [Intrasporangium sp.]HET7399014.1 RdgB/HAM1 family non-canonical purine NTP pyrophosphatase [Intrasporangium sp.]
MTAAPTHRRVVLATRNAHKVAELRVILADVCDALQLEIVGLDDYPDAPDVVEDGVTFEENALLKAVSAAEFTGLPALADDSGISVDVLGGAPGIFSARWSGGRGDRANLELLLAQLAEVRDEHRAAAFVCAAALALPDGTREVELGRLPGTVAREPRGAGGFGYDPVFRPDGSQRTLAEYAAEEKNGMSHRALAFRALAPRIEEHLRP